MSLWTALIGRVRASRAPSRGAGAPPEARVWFTGWLDWEAPRRAVRGESFHQRALESIAGPTSSEGYCLPVAVTLQREADNEYDSNAIRAEINGVLVGHIAKEVAAELGPLMDGQGISACIVAGVVRGGSFEAPNLGVHIWPDRPLGAAPS